MQVIKVPFQNTISPMQNGLVVATQRDFNNILSNDEFNDMKNKVFYYLLIKRFI